MTLPSSKNEEGYPKGGVVCLKNYTTLLVPPATPSLRATPPPEGGGDKI